MIFLQLRGASKPGGDKIGAERRNSALEERRGSGTVQGPIEDRRTNEGVDVEPLPLSTEAELRSFLPSGDRKELMATDISSFLLLSSCLSATLFGSTPGLTRVVF